MIDTQGKVIAWNHALEDLTGTKASSILGQGDYSYAQPFYGYNRPILIDFVFKKNEDIIEKYKYLKKDGDKIFAETLIKDCMIGKMCICGELQLRFMTHMG